MGSLSKKTRLVSMPNRDYSFIIMLFPIDLLLGMCRLQCVLIGCGGVYGIRQQVSFGSVSSAVLFSRGP